PPPAAEPSTRADSAPAVASDAAVALVTPPPGPDASIPNDCIETGAHVTQVLIDSAKDPTLKANYEHERDKIVRATAEACATQNWSADAKGCFSAAKAEADIRACEKKFPPPGSTPPIPHRPSKEG